MQREEVETFEVEMNLSVASIDVLGAIITEVKQQGRVSASTNIAYDCTHGEWLLGQIAYDRKIRNFSCRSVRPLADLVKTLPSDSSFIYSGTLQPKHAKRLVRAGGLRSVVARDAEGPLALDAAIDKERGRVEGRGLSRVSQARGRFLSEKGEQGEGSKGPAASVASGLGVFLRVESGDDAADVAARLREISEGCTNLVVEGLWAVNTHENEHEACIGLLGRVQEELDMPKLKVALRHYGPGSSSWFASLGRDSGRVLWVFDYDPTEEP